MPDIIHRLNIMTSPESLYAAVTEPAGLNQWWTKDCLGRPESGSLYELDFGNVQWQAQVTHCLPLNEFEIVMTRSDPDWMDTRIRFEIIPSGMEQSLTFSHLEWPRANEHFYQSNHCWGLYLRILRRYLEHQEQVTYEERLKV